MRRMRKEVQGYVCGYTGIYIIENHIDALWNGFFLVLWFDNQSKKLWQNIKHNIFLGKMSLK